MPILIWPLVAFCTIFFFDHPDSNNLTTWILFILVNVYPLILFLLYKLNSRIHNRYKKAGYILPLIFIISILYVLLSQIKSSNEFKKERQEKENKRIAEGYLGKCTTYKLKNDSLFYKHEFFDGDSITLELVSCHCAKDSKNVYRGAQVLENADPKTYERINWQWSKDKNHYYIKGEIIPDIDYDSFEILDDNYSKDKESVFYKTMKLINANSINFKTSSGTYEANDGENYYKHGELITTTNN